MMNWFSPFRSFLSRVLRRKQHSDAAASIAVGLEQPVSNPSSVAAGVCKTNSRLWTSRIISSGDNLHSSLLTFPVCFSLISAYILTSVFYLNPVISFVFFFLYAWWSSSHHPDPLPRYPSHLQSLRRKYNKFPFRSGRRMAMLWRFSRTTMCFLGFLSLPKSCLTSLKPQCSSTCSSGALALSSEHPGVYHQDLMYVSIWLQPPAFVCVSHVNAVAV